MIPDWQLPPGVDRGLWDYLHAAEMVATYDDQMHTSPLATADVAFCERAFPAPGRLLDLGCGTGRLCVHFARKGFDCVGVDLSEEMLAKARANAASVEGKTEWLRANLVEPLAFPAASFDYAACLFSTLGMVRGTENRAKVVANAFRALKPGGVFVLHAHNRFFRGLGWKRVLRQRWGTLFGGPTVGDIEMSQAYGGAPLTLHHFTRDEAQRVLTAAGFTVKETASFGIDGQPAAGGNVYGWLMLAERPV
ncbi:dTDP-3-amino-3,4,6-trideoxy-alpha-D-glucopyranose [Gemmata obscuriglobus]|nr:class I SAM-dependent methyltransferase [Gemmata obscuriglobus]QEG30672.1 dTDP-3-amino-3,4,6-trideoxy-alpha-D-glucopyranose [Gemmata obscuriglobus]VTS09999.1 Methyltransferase type 11 OS=Isosphaera pallida (strain ATCC 43644 / DSM 9630 / IS1B) GN=Isop_0474 PE=4 SV=1: Methyltransf_18 [Gemmata obscuriglobus UQM 2246]